MFQACSANRFRIGVASGLVLLAGKTFAAAPPGEARVELEEVVVTAEKRTSTVQTTAIAITAVGAEQLDSLGSTNLGDLQAVVPSMQFSTQSADAVRVQLTIRGIGSDVIEAGADAGVGLYLDGVYMGRTSAALMSIFDLERVEVLRGPQGTLYGRNTSGGAVNLISKAPTRNTEASLEASIGNYSAYALRGVVNGSLSDTVTARLTFGGEQRDGYQKNLFPGGTTGNDSKNGFARVQVRVAPSDSFEFLGTAYYDKIGGVGPSTKAFGGVPPVFATGVLPDGTPNMSGLFNASAYSLAAPYPADYHTVNKNSRESVDMPMKGVTATAKWNLGKSTFKSISSYQDGTQDQVGDVDGTNLPLLEQKRHEAARQFTQEFNLASQSDNSEWLLGAFYFRERVSDLLRVFGSGGFVGFGGPGGGLEQKVDGRVVTESYALFGQGSYSFSPRLKLTVGARLTDESRDITSSAGFVDRVNGAVVLGGGTTVRPSSSKSKSWRPFTWKVGVDSRLTDRVFAYGTVSTAFKSGGFNLANPLASAFEPEKMTAYEAGLKIRGFDNRLQTNFAVFHYDIKDIQLQIFGINGPELINATKGKASGIELESTAALSEDLRATFSGGWLKTKFDDNFKAIDASALSFLTPPGVPPPVTNVGGNRFTRAPQFNAALGLDYRHETGNGTALLAGVQYTYQDKVYFRIFNDNTQYRYQPGYGVLNLRAGYEWDAGKWAVTAHVKNVTDKDYITNSFVAPILIGGVNLNAVGAPRTFNLVLKHSFF